MRISTRIFWMPKHGNSEEEYEDAYYPEHELKEASVQRFRCAIADGATETSFAKSWANILVEDFFEERNLERSRASWSERISGIELPWYAEQKASNGAFAAFAGLILEDDGSLKITAAGDSCVFASRNSEKLFAFPLMDASQFNNRPALICSIGTPETEIVPQQYEGNWQINDDFWLLSDAIARWLLLDEKEENGFDRLNALKSNDEFRSFAEEQRKRTGVDGRSLLLNDDLTILHVHVN